MSSKKSAVEANSSVITSEENTSEIQVEFKPNFPPLTGNNIKREYFLYNMIAVDVFGFRNVKRDSDMVALSTQIQEETGRKDGEFPLFYSEIVQYTENMYFDFRPDAPPEYQNLKLWWEMVKAGTPASECYLWYIENVPNLVHNSLSDAISRAHRIWKPAQEKSKLTDKDADKNPN